MGAAGGGGCDGGRCVKDEADRTGELMVHG